MSVIDDPTNVAAATPTEAAAPARTAPASARKSRTWRRLRSNTGAMLALGFLILIALIAVFGPWIAPYDPNVPTDGGLLSGPSRSHWLGTDDRARDNLSRLLVGTRVSVLTSFAVVAMAALIAVPVGLISGYFRGRIDNILMRLVDAGLAFPPLILAIAVAGVLGPGAFNSMLALTAVFVPALIRLVRGQALSVREETFIDASRSMGTPPARILRTRMLANVRSPLLVQASLLSGSALLAEAGLSYLGLGATPPTPTWGNMLRRAYDSSLFTQQWQLFAPGLAIALTVLAFNVFGEGLRDALGVAQMKTPGRWGRRGLTIVDAPATPGPAPAAAAAKVAVRAPTPDPATPLVRISGLTVEFASQRGLVRVVDDLSLDIGHSEVLGLVGESGCGKSVTSQAIMRLLPSPPARIVAGSIEFNGRDLLQLPFNDVREVRGAGISMIFQDPMTSLDPTFTVGSQLIEAQRLHSDISRKAARARAIELLDMVGIPAPAQRVAEYPHQMSGGMRQRVMIAMALACEPKLLIADEPTTALDVTVQAQILDLLRSLQKDLGMSILFVTHDLGVVADVCDRVAVMYAGQIIEEQPVRSLFTDPQHPYTAGLLGAMPQVGRSAERLTVIPGRVPLPEDFATGCRFQPRCAYAQPSCGAAPVELITLGRTADGPASKVRCALTEQLELVGSRHD